MHLNLEYLRLLFESNLNDDSVSALLTLKLSDLILTLDWCLLTLRRLSNRLFSTFSSRKERSVLVERDLDRLSFLLYDPAALEVSLLLHLPLNDLLSDSLLLLS